MNSLDAEFLGGVMDSRDAEIQVLKTRLHETENILAFARGVLNDRVELGDSDETYNDEEVIEANKIIDVFMGWEWPL